MEKAEERLQSPEKCKATPVIEVSKPKVVDRRKRGETTQDVQDDCVGLQETFGDSELATGAKEAAHRLQRPDISKKILVLKPDAAVDEVEETSETVRPRSRKRRQTKTKTKATGAEETLETDSSDGRGLKKVKKGSRGAAESRDF